MSAPDYKHEPALPDFVLDKVPTVDLFPMRKKRRRLRDLWRIPIRVISPGSTILFFSRHSVNWSAFWQRNSMAIPLIEFVDTFLYGFWGEGHTWPFVNTPFPDYQTAERTWVKMIEVQLEHFTKTPLMTNTQPDYSRVGNSEVLDRTIRSNNWIRSDTIFIENEQIEDSQQPPAMDRRSARTGDLRQRVRSTFAVGRRDIRAGKHDRSRDRRRGELLVALELSRDQRQESA